MNEKIVEILKSIFHGQLACSLPSPSNGGCEIFSREGSNFYCPQVSKMALLPKNSIRTMKNAMGLRLK
jgi:hypothetical protein